MERLYCAQEAAQTGDLDKLLSSIDLLKQWQPEHPLHHEAQRLIKEWSGQVLAQATRKVEQGDLKGAEVALSHIPGSTPVYADAQKQLAHWRKYAKKADNIYAKAQLALKQRQWDVVSEQITLLAEFEREYWTLEKGANLLGQQLGTEKQAWKVLTRAQKMAATNDLSQIRVAIPVALQVPVDTYVAATAKTNLRQWSQKLVTAGLQKWQKGDQAGATAMLQLPADISNTAEIDELYRFGNAYRLFSAAFAEKWVPSAGGIVNLMEAVAALEQVKSTSPFYAQAQAQKKNWQVQLKDVIQLKYASATASLGRPAALRMAIAQAQQVPPGHPRRVQAQSLMAYWRQEAERLEDQPLINEAMRLAKAGNINALKAAIVQASQVELGRALRSRAQALIADWHGQIETIEDRPKLDRAWQLARQDKLDQAIQAASQIRPKRALYQDAQNAIADWRYQQIVNAQIAQDQPILDRATALAESGNLGAAINMAAQIGSGRALSGQAQASIYRWQEQLRPAPVQSSSSEPASPSGRTREMLKQEPTASPTAPETETSFPTPPLLPHLNHLNNGLGLPSSIQLAPPPPAAPEASPQPLHENSPKAAPEPAPSEPPAENPPPYTYVPAPAAEPSPAHSVNPLPPSPER
jgi:soluble cytochrome b562